VVGRALGCDRIVAEASAIAVSDGASEPWVADVVDHLSAPELTPQEAILVPFARETVWYEAPRIQERARQLSEALTQEELVEAIGVLSVANAVCRLAAAVGEP
jgi:alkylhydroperoxidase family enzyme